MAGRLLGAGKKKHWVGGQKALAETGVTGGVDIGDNVIAKAVNKIYITIQVYQQLPDSF